MPAIPALATIATIATSANSATTAAAAVTTLAPDNYAEVVTLLDAREWAVCCLCAAWCDVCTEFRARFDRLALQHPDKVLLWIDIEDRADLVDEFDVENFPTLLIQRGDDIFFFGTVEPDEKSLNRLIASTTRDDPSSQASVARHALREKLRAALPAAV